MQNFILFAIYGPHWHLSAAVTFTLTDQTIIIAVDAPKSANQSRRVRLARSYEEANKRVNLVR